MATFLDLGFLDYFSILFVFLFVLFTVYGLLKYTNLFKDNEGIYAIIALAVAALFVLFKPAREIFIIASPWFVIMFIFIFFIMIALSFIGVGGGNIGKELGKSRYYRTVVYWVIAIGIIIMMYSFSQVIGQDVGPYLGNESDDTNTVSRTGDNIRGESGVGTDDFNTNLGATIFHPKVLGLLVILLIASFSIRLLSTRT